MNEGYKQASEISRNLILTFIFGIIIGTVIGWGARSTIVGPAVEPGTPPAVTVAREIPPAESPAPDTTVDAAPKSPAPESVAPAPVASPEPEIVPVTQEAPEVEGATFNADVEGLWPAAHLFVGIQGTKADVDTLEWLNEFKPGGVVLGPENVTDALQLAALVLQIKQAVGLGTKITDPPLIVYADDYHAFPRILPVDGDASDTQQTPERATAQAREALKQGVGVFLGPALDIFIPGVSDELVMASSSDPESGLSYANQLSGAGLIAVARTFPGAGPAVKAEDGTWHIPGDQMDALATAMRPFKTAIDAGIPGILVGHMAVPGIDTERPNRPAALSPRLLQLLVRQDWQYTGVLIASDITRHPMTKDLPRDEIALKALFSGCDAVILKDANRATLRTIGDTFVRLATRSDFPVVQFAASRQRLKDLLKGLGTPHAAPEPSPAPAVAETPAVDAPATPPAPEPAPNVAETPAPTPAPEPAPAVAETPTPAPEPAPVVAETPAPEPAPAVAETPAPEPAPAVAETPTPREHTIAKGDSLNALAKRYGVTVENLRAWNSMNSDVVKIGQVLKIVAPEVAVPAEAAPVEAPAEPTPVEAPVTESVPAEPVTVAQPPDTDKREHTVASGETLGSIAGMYGVTVSDIQAWNGLDAGETVINAGAALVVYLPMAVPEEGSPTPEAPASAEKQTATKPAPGDYDTYEVAQGDNLRRIAQRFGTTQQKLMEMNDLKSADLVQIGWKLKVPRQAAAEITGSNP